LGKGGGARRSEAGIRFAGLLQRCLYLGSRSDSITMAAAAKNLGGALIGKLKPGPGSN